MRRTNPSTRDIFARRGGNFWLQAIPARTIARWALGCAIVCSPAVAAAQEAESFSYPPCDRTPSDKDVAGAKGAFQAGNASFDEADYDRAITYWEDAFRRDCTAHPLLLNLARAYELDGKRERAIVALQTYLERSPDAASQQAQIQRRIDKLKEQLAQSAPPPKAQPAEQAPVAAPTTQQTGATTSQTPTQDTGATGERPLWPLFVAGGGAAIFIVGGILYLGAASDVSDFEKQCSGRDGCPNDKVASDANSARTRKSVSGVVTLVGAAAMAGGIIYYFVQQPEPATTARVERHLATVTPAVSPGFAGLQLSGAF